MSIKILYTEVSERSDTVFRIEKVLKMAQKLNIQLIYVQVNYGI